MKDRSRKDCLGDDRLVALYYGDATPEEREHRQSCIECQRRYRRLEDDLARIGEALSDPPPAPIHVHPSSFGVRWLPATAGLVVVALVAWSLVGMWPATDPELVASRDSDTPRSALVVAAEDGASTAAAAGDAGDRPGDDDPPAAGDDGALTVALAEVGEAVFETLAADPVTVATDDEYFAYLQAALDGEFPCVWQDPLYTSGCDNDLLGFSL